MTAAIVCAFTEGLEDIPCPARRDPLQVLRVLAGMPRKRFSVFEATSTLALATTLTNIVREGYIATDTSCGYPWTAFTITDKGRAALAEAEAVACC